jgi:hypothetical protein
MGDESPFHLVALAARDGPHLEELAAKTMSRDIEIYLMDDADLEVGPTAFATEPLDGEQRKVFSQLPLWRPVR